MECSKLAFDANSTRVMILGDKIDAQRSHQRSRDLIEFYFAISLTESPFFEKKPPGDLRNFDYLGSPCVRFSNFFFLVEEIAKYIHVIIAEYGMRLS